MVSNTFTRAGSGQGPDPTALLAAITGVLAVHSVSARIDVAGVYSVVVEKVSTWLPAEITAVQSAINGVPDSTLARTLQSGVDQLTPLDRAILLTILDQVNVIRAALPTPLGVISPAQVVAAVRNKIISF